MSAAPAQPKPKTHPEPTECRITVNPEMDRVVVIVGDLAVGLPLEDAMAAGLQLADAIKIVGDHRKGLKAVLQ